MSTQFIRKSGRLGGTEVHEQPPLTSDFGFTRSASFLRDWFYIKTYYND
ncbi:hypothetical protein L917_14771 [Phytophthora nicotianae]|uniref:Uncharacterized protein n=3 Tax=Phytophthora nicotianae TaxID=4792 RepID=V9EI19_PHYNI|nr:hypothetical protein F443_15493 [Phytophthora nicotianae P1569]ETL85726.1 hypothetical protein L917_14771 [Phytophthora nicotianae]ETM38881.1 hypothetical protein L914_14906 [Phytophthora nicotianae]ETO67585.1 hypothetical protein F444_15499 [Phytophthora nicotianae P1976]